MILRRRKTACQVGGEREEKEYDRDVFLAC